MAFGKWLDLVSYLLWLLCSSQSWYWCACRIMGSNNLWHRDYCGYKHSFGAWHVEGVHVLVRGPVLIFHIERISSVWVFFAHGLSLVFASRRTRWFIRTELWLGPTWRMALFSLPYVISFVWLVSITTVFLTGFKYCTFGHYETLVISLDHLWMKLGSDATSCFPKYIDVDMVWRCRDPSWMIIPVVQ